MIPPCVKPYIWESLGLFLRPRNISAFSPPLGGTVASFHTWKKLLQLCRGRSDGARREEAWSVGVWRLLGRINRVRESGWALMQTKRWEGNRGEALSLGSCIFATAEARHLMNKVGCRNEKVQVFSDVQPSLWRCAKLASSSWSWAAGWVKAAWALVCENSSICLWRRLRLAKPTSAFPVPASLIPSPHLHSSSLFQSLPAVSPGRRSPWSSRGYNVSVPVGSWRRI